MWRWAIAASLALIEPSIAFAQPVPEDNSEMATLFEADQETRRNATPKDYQDQAFVRRMIEEDETRRSQTQELLAAGALSTGNDYYRAAFIFQHGGNPDAFLLAHTLAVAARHAVMNVLLGSPPRRWTAIYSQSDVNKYTEHSILGRMGGRGQWSRMIGV